MILGFSTQFNGKPTYFVEKIHKGIRENYMLSPIDPTIHYPLNYNFIAKDKLAGKYHTIRKDTKERWKIGTTIDFFINVRKKDMFRFAPALPVVSSQEVLIRYEYDFYSEVTRPTLWIDGILFYDTVKRCDFGMLQLSINDGFDSIEDFFTYFSEDFDGKIIHWTDLKY